MKRIHWVIPLVAVAAICGWLKLAGREPSGAAAPQAESKGGKAGKGGKGGPVPVRVTPAAEEVVERVVEVTGSITARREVAVAAERTGKVVFVGAEEGDRVTAGQVLVRLDDTEARSRRARAQATQAQAKSRLAQARTNTRLTTAQTDSGVVQAEGEVLAAKTRTAQAESSLKLAEEQTEHRIAQAQKDLEESQQALQLVLAGARPQEKAQAQASVDATKADIEQVQADLAQAGTDVEQAQLEYNRVKGLLDKGFVPEQRVDTARFRLTAAQTGVATTKARLASSKTRLKQAEERLSILNEGARPEEVAIAKARVAQNEAALREAQAQRTQIEVRRKELEEAQLGVRQQEEAKRLAEANRGKVAAGEEEIRALRAGVEQATAELALAGQELRDCIVSAPLSGTVSHRLVEPGAVITPGAPLLKLLSSGTVFFAAEVPERDIAAIRVGQCAEVTVDALPGEKLSGSVVELLPSGEVASRRFVVNIALPNPRGRLREGMFARGRLVVQRQVTVVLVPLDAIVRREGKEFVAVVTPPDKVAFRPVKLGVSREDKTEIVEGLQAGETVVTQGAQGLKPDSLVEIVQ
jgi:RND family efflux transporter MFP subunit